METKYPDPQKIRRILIIKLRGIGDVVLSTVILDNLRENFPGAEIEYLTEKPSYSALKGLEQVNDVILFDGKTLFGKLNTLRIIRKKNYDLIFDFYSNPTTALLTFFSGAKFRVGFPYSGRKYAYNGYGPVERDKYHAAVLHLKTLELNKITSAEKNLYFYVNEKHNGFVKQYITANNLSDTSLIGICPTGGWASKKCDPEKFAEIGNSVVEKFGGKLVLIGGPGDENDVLTIKSMLRTEALVAPKTTINEMAALFNECKFLIANDSGPMHIATAVGTPVLALHGPTDPKLQGPFGEQHEYLNLETLDCIKCNLLDCPREHECFRNLSTSEVLHKIESLIKKNDIRL